MCLSVCRKQNPRSAPIYMCGPHTDPGEQICSSFCIWVWASPPLSPTYMYTSGSRGPAPLAPKIFSKSLQFWGNFKGKPLIWANFGLRGPPGVKPPLGPPLTKILDPPLPPLTKVLLDPLLYTFSIPSVVTTLTRGTEQRRINPARVVLHWLMLSSAWPGLVGHRLKASGVTSTNTANPYQRTCIPKHVLCPYQNTHLNMGCTPRHRIGCKHEATVQLYAPRLNTRYPEAKTCLSSFSEAPIKLAVASHLRDCCFTTHYWLAPVPLRTRHKASGVTSHRSRPGLKAKRHHGQTLYVLFIYGHWKMKIESENI